MNTKTNRFQLPENSATQLETAYLVDGTPVDFLAFGTLAGALEKDLAALEARFEDFVTAQSQQRSCQRTR